MIYVLVHSPSVGPATWERVAASLRARDQRVAVPDVRAVANAKPPFWRTIVELIRQGLNDLPRGERVVLCGHSNAGLFLPMTAANFGPAVAGLIFVDASLPPETGGAAMVPPEFLEQLRRQASDGYLPRWTEWFPEEDVSPLFPDAETRRRVSEEQVRLPLAYYEDHVPVPSGWSSSPAGYVLFGPPYDRLAQDVRTRGWPVIEVPGQHLHMLVDPDGVAQALLEIAVSLTHRQRH
ncbi:MAG TPA: alpha/beta fold hydrolase [Candidatus Dormibacteraeota bacterium]|nr:alpha/beta fold hydrolase [Candidatus Dormibacteraeota bacterium]